MKKKAKILILLLIGASVSVLAQDVDAIRSNPDYVWGQGFSDDYQSADNEAIKDLVSQIVANINSETETTITNEQSGDDAKSSVSTTGVLKISSTVSIPNCKRIVKDMDGSFFVLRYVEAAEIERMFDARKSKIRDLIAAGERAESHYKIGDALRNYYWALKLINSIPEEHSSNLTTENGTLLFTMLKERIGDVMDSCKIVADKRLPADEDKHEVELAFTYKGHPIVSCDYKFYDGYEWSTAAVKDGIASVEVPADASQMHLRLEYIGEKLWKSDAVVNDLLTQQSSVIPFPQFEKRITLTMLQEEKPQPVPTAQKLVRDMRTDSIAICEKKELAQQADIVAPLIKAVETRKYDDVKPLCTENGWKWFEKLVKYGNAKIINRSDLEVSAFANGYLVRGVKAKFSFKRNNKSFVEDLVFYIKDGKIDGINFGLEQSALDDIMRHSMWEPKSRQVLVNFLENYKTAYALERIDYLDAVFSEDALIIIGNKITEHTADDAVALNQERYEKCRMTKGQYIDRLRNVFAKQEYVNIQFEDAAVKKTSHDANSERYEIIIKQHYYSTTYADKGYLFLLADISDPERPVIHVRVWDEDKNALMDYAEWTF